MSAKSLLANVLHAVGWASCSVIALGMPAGAQAQFGYMTNADDTNTITITNYTGPGGVVTIPTNINGLNIASIGAGAFHGCSNVTSVTIPDSVTCIEEEAFGACSSLTNIMIGRSVTNIGQWAFVLCTNLTSAYFKGNAPGGDWYNEYGPDCPPFEGDYLATAYYVPRASGWESIYGYVLIY